ncbi:hypothetical protein KEM48_008188 [Puccinia striiformis f. sp. tritici PST-130]|nr:hypothetical protein KEM48_008188 [Puccinia striiformis f. sp. tritici PST-130]
MALHYGGIPFTDERLAPEWLTSDFKDSLPFGQVPILTIDENKVISQEGAIILYVGAWWDFTRMIEKKLSRSTSRLALSKVRPSLHDPSRTRYHNKDDNRGAYPQDPRLPDKYLASHETTFSAGNSLTVADLRIFAVLRLLKSGMLQGLPTDLVDRYPQIAKLCKAIESHEKIASWLKVKSQ